ncbi:TIGR03619 family F420-dependent LLM class oxidoreductase [Kribbella sp. NPDC055071]
MQLGIALPSYGAENSGPGPIVETAEAAERIGLDSLWTFERILRPIAGVRAGTGPAFVLPPHYNVSYAPLETLAYVAARTSRIRLGTSIVNALFHPPAILGRRYATLDQLSGGRVVVGLGQGWMAEEFATAGIPMSRRGAGFSEYLDAMRAVWAPDPVSFSGRFYQFAESDAGPKPAQAGGPPIVVGTGSPAGIDRAARAGVGINPIASDLASLEAVTTRFRAAAAEAGHDPAVLPIIVRVNNDITPEPLGSDRPLLAGSAEQVAADLTKLEPLGVTEAFWAMEIPWQERVPALQTLRSLL